MKLKQLLISTASIAALAVVPMSIVSCGNNNNNSVDQLPPANGGDNNNSNPGGSDNNGSNNGGSTGGSDNGGNNNNQQPTIEYIDVKNKDEMVAHILQSNYIATEFIRQATPNKSFNKKLERIEWTNSLKQMICEDRNITVTEDSTYTYYNVRVLTFIYQGASALKYTYYDDNNQLVTQHVSGNGSATISVDIHFRSTTKFVGN